MLHHHLWLASHLPLLFFIALCAATFFYFLMRGSWRLHSVSLCAFVFLAFVSPRSCVWLFVSTCLVSVAMIRRWHSLFGVILVLASVFLWEQAFSRIHQESLLPNSLSFLGIAYYTCRHIHVLVERYRGRIQSFHWVDYFHYSFFLPVLMNGPIHRYPHFLRSCQRRYFDWADIFSGMERILYGYGKVILLGEYLFNKKAVLWLSVLRLHSSWSEFLSSANQWIVLYMVFSGYTDVALGFAKMWGISIEENFNYPFLARNLIEFWQRWHITLSQWCKDYIYLPVLAYTRNPFFAVLLAMIGIGVWHQLSAFYLLWACYQALGIVLCRLYQRVDLLRLKKLPSFLRHGLTRLLTFSWLFSAKPLIFWFLHWSR